MRNEPVRKNRHIYGIETYNNGMYEQQREKDHTTIIVKAYTPYGINEKERIVSDTQLYFKKKLRFNYSIM